MSLLCRARAGRYMQIIIFYFLIQKICVNLPAIRQAGLRPKWDFLYYQVVIWFQEVIVGVIK